MENRAGKPVDVAPGSGHRVWVDLPEDRLGAFIARFV
jgi:putative protease